MNIHAQKQKLVVKFYNELTFNEAKKVTSIVTSNHKLQETGKYSNHIVAGIALYPAFKGSINYPLERR